MRQVIRPHHNNHDNHSNQSNHSNHDHHKKKKNVSAPKRDFVVFHVEQHLSGRLSTDGERVTGAARRRREPGSAHGRGMSGRPCAWSWPQPRTTRGPRVQCLQRASLQEARRRWNSLVTDSQNSRHTCTSGRGSVRDA